MAPPPSGRRDDDDAPWLAEADNDVRSTTSVPRGRVIGGIILFLLLLTLVIVGVYVVISKKQDGATGTGVARAEDAPLISADAGPNKVKPDDAGGLQLEDEGDATQRAGGGEVPTGDIDAARAPEEPEPRPGSAPVSILPETEQLPAIPPATTKTTPAKPAPAMAAPVAPAPTPQAQQLPTAKSSPVAAAVVPKPIAPAPAAVVTPAKSGGTTLQLGAFSSQAKAELAWTSLTSRYPYLAGLSKRIEPVERDTGTLFRLRAGGSADAATAVATCAKLKVAGEACVVTP
jgi:cell division protein FtsN